MKKLLLTAMAGALCLTGMAERQLQSMVSADGNTINIRSCVDQKLLDILKDKAPEARTTTPAQKKAPLARPAASTMRKAKAEAETIEYTAFAKSLYENGYTYSYENGDMSSYKVTITFDGDKATFTNLFNIDEAYAGYGHIQYDMTGDYDAETGKITFETPMDFEDGCEFGYVYGYYTGIVRGGYANENAGFDASCGILSFTVSEDRKQITSDQNMILMFGTGTQGYNMTGMKFINLYAPQEGSKVISMSSDVISFREDIFPELSETKSLLFANVGAEPAEFVVDCESEGDAMSADPVSGTIEPMSLLTVDVTFTPQEEGQYEGIITLVTETDEYIISATGACVGGPDYSGLVKSGEFKFSTGMEFPWQLGDQNGNPIARSTNIMIYGDSWLKAKFTVPEGKIATISWKGNSFVSQYFASQATVTNDYGDQIFTSWMDYEEFDGSSKFAPGEHYLLFNYNVSYAGYTTEDDWMMVCDFETSYEDLQEANSVLESGDVMQYGNFLSGENSSYKNIVLQNLGSNPLKVTGVKSSDNFKLYPTDDAAETMGRLNVSVEFVGAEAGKYDETVEVSTTAGDYTVQCLANVYQTPDYSKVISPESDPSIEFTWINNAADPFILDEEKNQLVNANAGLDSVASYSWVSVDFVIPQGKMGRVSWEASLDVTGLNEEGFNSDIAWIDFMSYQGFTFGGISKDCMASDTVYVIFEGANAWTPGLKTIQWRYNKNGDGHVDGADEFRIWNLRVDLEDFDGFGYSLDKEQLDFGTLFQGKSSTQRIILTNEGADQLMIESVEYNGPISSSYIPSYGCSFHGQFWLDFTFTAEEAGAFEGSIVMHTTSGNDIVIPCVADVLSTEGYLLVGDFEDNAEGWTRVDADGDGKGWDLLWSLFGGYPEGHTHSGADGLGSTAYYYYSPDLDPDNWTISPAIEVPAEGEYELSWWIGVEEDEYDFCQHYYTVYVGEDASGLEDSMDEVFSEQLDQTGWQPRSLSLADYAGKTVNVAFRHHMSMGMRLLKLDDVMVQMNDIVGIKAITDVNTTNRQVYGISGARQNGLNNGVNIVRTVKADGSVDVQKIVK